MGNERPQETWGDRVRRLRGERSQGVVLEALAVEGVDRAQNWLSRIETNKTRALDIEELQALARVLGSDPYFILTGEYRYVDDTPFVATMRSIESQGLDDRGRYVIEKMAWAELEEAKKRFMQSELTDEESELIRLVREAGPEALRLLLAGARGAVVPVPESVEPHQEERPDRSERPA